MNLAVSRVYPPEQFGYEAQLTKWLLKKCPQNGNTAGSLFANKDGSSFKRPLPKETMQVYRIYVRRNGALQLKLLGPNPKPLNPKPYMEPSGCNNFQRDKGVI